MVFSSTIFLFLFLPIVLILYFNPIFKGRKYRNFILLGSSLVFYAWGEPVYVFVMIGSIVINWLLGIWMEKKWNYRKTIAAVAVAYNVLLLFVFKYLSFLLQELNGLLKKDIFSLSIALPIGISFFTFQLLSYIFDVYYGTEKAQKNVFSLGLYISMFPQLIAGPIVRYGQIAEEIDHRKETREDFTEGMTRFIYGLGKKVLLSNYLAQIADNVFGTAGGCSVMTAWIGAVAYTLQIYFDFSGYSDMAIGLGRMFGFHFAENFHYPYMAKSITDFWRRWHISLSSWFRDYVYIPLGGKRVKKARWIFNLFAVWTLTGIWHGANWTFLLWGLFYFVLLLTEKMTGLDQKLGKLSHVYTLLMVILAWVMFRAENVSEGLRFIGNMFGIGAAGFADKVFFNYLWNGKLVLLAAVIFAAPVAPAIKKKLSRYGELAEAGEALLLLAIFLLSMFVTVSSTYNPFIYFNF